MEKEKMYQSITGPVRGHYIATYACPVGELGDEFVGYFKIFRDLPRCYCTSGQVAEGSGPVRFRLAEHALEHGKDEAMRTIASFDSSSVLNTTPPGIDMAAISALPRELPQDTASGG
jgi:hypothetical protein